MTFAFDNTYAALPDHFYARLAPVPVKLPELVKLNGALAEQLGLDPDALAAPDGVAMLAGNQVPDGADPLAMAYAGHQFGNFVPQLGDGRAILLGEILAPDGERFDIQLKGSGRTPFSRAGDGRAWLGPVLREYIVSEAMSALGIPTTRSLAAVATGEIVYRESPLPGAVLTRVARSHVRIGTFEYFLMRQDIEAIHQLADYVMARHYPDAREDEHPYRALLESVIDRQARLVARWLGVGFIHGVMNTDNMSIAGETIDYGPCAFMDNYHPSRVYSSIDHGGRYAYGNQPRIAQWNLARLAQALLPILDADQDKALAMAQAAVDGFPQRFETAYLEVFRAKLGLSESHPEDGALVTGLLEAMSAADADFTNSFRALCDAALGREQGIRDELRALPALDDWLSRWRARLELESLTAEARAALMRHANPAVIPRNHRVEEALSAAVEGDLGPLDALLDVLASPWEEATETPAFQRPPAPHEVVRQTFCGT
ncbi:YdiU family protein [Thiorhodococcus mannitoliphagus]|uniref:Protein nucleotidyltransferase YdiU n=1 Tax=Thiorhodococcus mannitoliphagus TaxID=329406 RepID=A0A6P1DXI3_9GAMM|nr:YdiU family protein [Thiorhodococcus mannitoliphagus]NEX22190.1 YdiU family protein [Thiorhodococcus mannitoliphagus]